MSTHLDDAHLDDLTAMRADISAVLGDLPGPASRAVAEQDVRRRHLEVEVGGPPPAHRVRRLSLVAGVAGAAVLLAAGSAVAYKAWAPASDTSYAQCFTSASLDDLGTTVSVASGGATATPPAVDALEGCTTVWRAGLLELGAPGTVDRETLATDAPVPDLVACVLTSGAVGVFPGDDQTCFELGLPQLATG